MLAASALLMLLLLAICAERVRAWQTPASTLPAANGDKAQALVLVGHVHAACEQSVFVWFQGCVALHTSLAWSFKQLHIFASCKP